MTGVTQPYLSQGVLSYRIVMGESIHTLAAAVSLDRGCGHLSYTFTQTVLLQLRYLCWRIYWRIKVFAPPNR